MVYWFRSCDVGTCKSEKPLALGLAHIPVILIEPHHQLHRGIQVRPKKGIKLQIHIVGGLSPATSRSDYNLRRIEMDANLLSASFFRNEVVSSPNRKTIIFRRPGPLRPREPPISHSKRRASKKPGRLGSKFLGGKPESISHFATLHDFFLPQAAAGYLTSALWHLSVPAWRIRARGTKAERRRRRP